MKNNTQNISTKKISLGNFVNEHKDLISVMGIFAALTLFAKNIIPGLLGEVISFLFMSIFVLLWLEFWSTFPPKNASTRLSWFETTSLYAGLAIIVYWFVYLKEHSLDLFIYALSFVVASAFMVFISRYIQKSDLFNRIFNTTKGKKISLRFIVGLMIAMAVFYLVVTAVRHLTEKLNPQIEIMINALIRNPIK